ncbi:MAG: hypothetical protein CM15mV101_380 [uncultured marine virus]|nr:MAG: hypothetical protein CM15mV101_380 [uncultured marine virus]
MPGKHGKDKEKNMGAHLDKEKEMGVHDKDKEWVLMTKIKTWVC